MFLQPGSVPASGGERRDRFMKKWRPYSLFLLLLISGALLTGAGYAGEHSIYADYSRQNGWMTPALSLVFQGAKDGVAPWELFAGPAQTAAGPEGGEDRESACAQAGKETRRPRKGVVF